MHAASQSTHDQPALCHTNKPAKPRGSTAQKSTWSSSGKKVSAATKCANGDTDSNQAIAAAAPSQSIFTAEYIQETNSLCRYLFASSSSSSEVNYMAGIVMPMTADKSPLLQQHECHICFDNMDVLETHSIEFKILDGEVSRKKLMCSAPACEEPLSEELIATFATPEMFAKYQSIMMN